MEHSLTSILIHVPFPLELIVMQRLAVSISLRTREPNKAVVTVHANTNARAHGATDHYYQAVSAGPS
eukprot:COSAG02_NODE_3403_length_6798_cov_63.887744_11_plen_66_part_01